MKSIKILLYTTAMCLMLQSAAIAQTQNLSETFKEHFNQTVLKVADAETADEKRAILNESFDKMITAIERIESVGNLSEADLAILASYKKEITLKSDELNGLNGFNEISDENLDEFSDYSQHDLEQANNRTITIGLTTLLLIILILILL